MTTKRTTRKRPGSPGPGAELDDAIAATLKIMEDDPERVSDPTLPLYQYVAKGELEKERHRFEAGDKNALLGAIRICATSELPLPHWVASEFIRGYDAVLNCRAGSWDDAFGRPFPKGTHLAALRKRRRGRIQVMLEVRAAKARGESVNFKLFEQIGSKLGFGKTLAQELYAEARRQWPYLASIVPETSEE